MFDSEIINLIYDLAVFHGADSKALSHYQSKPVNLTELKRMLKGLKGSGERAGIEAKLRGAGKSLLDYESDELFGELVRRGSNS